MKKVALITTGGTIASKYNEDGRLVAGVMTGSELCRMLHLPEHIELEIYSMLQKPSMHVTHEDLDRIGEKMNELFQDRHLITYPDSMYQQPPESGPLPVQMLPSKGANSIITTSS